ncbi:DUF3265 domain-containing protein [Photobacterium angustum]|nr:DUF3265 domain-containing protein [Photobacterium angustum]
MGGTIRIILNTWDFYYALCFVVKVVCRRIALLTLTER